jgi:hypothetical protein
MIARFPGQHCTVCGSEFIPGESEIELDPHIKGPKGGSRYTHAHGCAKKNPAKARGLTRRGEEDLTPREAREVEQLLADFYAGKKPAPVKRPAARPGTRRR